ncbi:hypothetical protein ETI08_09790 [Macrococcoides goetzii]|nr:hypothetical protein [Macrococcus goetzii]TDM40340.1 hypothetical protein ETI10_06780 [Macrococcus goetzii]TDM45646.1 hypothetical protein ETI08_09790 [Macrococcus goetzii]
MKNKALYIIQTIERLAKTSKGGKRAHTKGFNYSGDVVLNAEGQKILGQYHKAHVRLSDALTNKNHFTKRVPLKGMAIQFKGNDPIDLVLVTFPYFPFTQSDSIYKIAQYSNAIHNEENVGIKLNLIRHLMKIEGFNKDLKKFIFNQPILTTFKQKTYYNLHYFRTLDDQFVRFRTKLKGETIYLQAEIHQQPHPISELPKDFKLIDIGTIQLNEAAKEEIEVFDLYKTGSNLTVLDTDEIIQLRSEMYKISQQRRISEGINHDSILPLDKLD